jgi:glycosyltransferase involved in cell wall biosynthesis
MTFSGILIAATNRSADSMQLSAEPARVQFVCFVCPKESGDATTTFLDGVENMPFDRDPARDVGSDTQPLLSIVVAAYNIEGYIEEALESLLRQPHLDKLRIIVVDDGSTDDTYALAQAIAERDGHQHIQVLRQENGGLSAARNTGLAAVTTPYVGFLDGDDIFLESFSGTVIPALNEHQWDLIEFNVKIIDDDGRRLDEIGLVEPDARGGHAMHLEDRMSFVDAFHTFVWARVYRTSLFDGLTFPVGRHYEDMAVTPTLYLRAASIYRVALPLIGYRRRFGSITQKAALRDMRDLRTNGLEALAQCKGGEMDQYWLTVFDKLFQRARHVCARVSRGSFRQASDILIAMVNDYRLAHATLPVDAASELMQLKQSGFDLRADRSMYLLKGIVKRVLRRSLDHHQRARRPRVAGQLSGH